MDLKYLLAGVLVIVVIALGSLDLNSISGFIVAGDSELGIQVNVDNGQSILTHDVLISPQESAFDALKRVALVDYRIFATGTLITGINGVNSDDEHYWLCFVNGKMPEVGCDYYRPNEEDVITFRYLTTEEAARYF